MKDRVSERGKERECVRERATTSIQGKNHQIEIK